MLEVAYTLAGRGHKSLAAPMSEHPEGQAALRVLPRLTWRPSLCTICPHPHLQVKGGDGCSFPRSTPS